MKYIPIVSMIYALFAYETTIAQNPDDVYWDTSIRPTNPRLVGTVDAIVNYNGLTIIGGSFYIAGLKGANNIAAWDGFSWAALGSGTDSTILALSVYDGKLIVGGDFTSAGGIASNHIASWDGSRWSTLGDGTNGHIRATAIFDGKLVAGGCFTLAGTTLANNVASWDGSYWSPLATGTYGCVQAFTILNGRLMVGWTIATGFPFSYGDTSGISIWDGSAFTDDISLGKYIRIPSGGLGVYHDELISSVLYTGCPDWGCSVGSLGFWRQDHWTWENNEGGGALTIWGDKLIVIGSAGYWGGQIGEVNKLSAWDGDNWMRLIDPSDLNDFNALGISGGEFFLGGRFGTENIATWVGANWLPVGIDFQFPFQDRSVSLVAVYDNKVIVGECIPAGEFEMDGSTSLISAWDGSSWTSLGSEIINPIEAFTIYDNKLVAAGSFDSISDIAAQSIACWDGTSWSSLASGINGQINCLTVYKGKLVAGGWLLGANGSTPPIAMWDGTSWSSLGPGINQTRGEVYALTVYDNKLIAGGMFDSVGAITVRNIAAWDGLSWSPLGTGLTCVRDLLVYENKLIANSLWGDGMWLWDGTSWSPLEGAPDGVSAMTVHDGKLIVAGRFDNAGGVECNNIAAWDGCSWFSLGSGLRKAINYWTPIPQGSALSTYDDKLVVGGYFTTAGDKSSLNLALWTKHDQTDVEEQVARNLPSAFCLDQNYPNPFNPSTIIEYNVATLSHVTIDIFNVLGQKVRTLVDETKAAGSYRTEWSSTDDFGTPVSTGVYLCRFNAGDVIQTRKMLLVK